MKIEYNKVTWYSTLIAVILYVGTFFFAFYLGEQVQLIKDSLAQFVVGQNQKTTTSTTTVTPSAGDSVINSAVFYCDGGKTINAVSSRQSRTYFERRQDRKYSARNLCFRSKIHQ